MFKLLQYIKYFALCLVTFTFISLLLYQYRLFQHYNISTTSWYMNFKGGDDQILEYWRNRGVITTHRLFIREAKTGELVDDVQAYRSNLVIPKQHNKTDLTTLPMHLDINGSDVLVMVHIQKTGGTTLEDHLVKSTTVLPPCQCKPMPDNPSRPMCSCVNSKGQDWLFIRHAVGWPCGVHPGFMELTSCIETWYRSQDNERRKRRYHYVTMLRDPVPRFISEWRHVQRGATWKECRLLCDGKDATETEVPFCFKHGTWKDVTFEDFIECESNMGFNRQTRMLANLSLSGCYRKQHANLTRVQRDEIMLQSAKDNLARFFSFFGLTEYQRESQLLLEKKFVDLKMKTNFTDEKGALGTYYITLSETHWEQALQKNLLDIRLYQYAKDLFFQRLKRAKIPLFDHARMFGTVEANFTYTKFS